ncbi:hypothetical protein MRB53_033223 [Persea americana]|uniref:Uncharacterized protein n=1 Tax=Persea americana TaxID=3435 RepID=A0ACC2KUA3_PERAE|nr:hypothetical protein MRB53_033223 [Persea americana]
MYASPSLFRSPPPPPPLNLRSRSLNVSASATSSPPLSPTVRSPASSSSLYDVLGLSSAATCHDVKAAYRRLVRTCHPDVVATDKKDTSADEFMRIHAAYSTLSDPEKRADYDRKHVFRLERRPFSPASFGGHGRRTWETDQCW